VKKAAPKPVPAKAAGTAVAGPRKWYAIFLPEESAGVYHGTWGAIRSAIFTETHGETWGKKLEDEAACRAWLLFHRHAEAATKPVRYF